MSHMQTRTHKIQHNSELGEATTFPLIVYFVLGQRINTQMSGISTKSRESTWPRCVHVECDAPLESFQGELQVCFRLHPNRRSKQKVITCKVLKVQTETILGVLFGSPGTKNYSNVGVAERCKEYYMGEGGGFLQVRAVVNIVSPRLLVTCRSTKGAPKCELTNLLVGLMQVRVSY
jgi:hypothetical protein